MHLLNWYGKGNVDPVIEIGTVKSAIALSNYYKRTAFEVWEELTSTNPLDELSDLQLEIYKGLCLKFSTADGLKTAEKYGMPERTFKYWLKTDSKIFKRVGHGTYEKLYQR
jgi:hypothetical protein